MCRFIAYLGQPLPINDVISRPEDSLIKQSLEAQDSEIKVNGDGFGIGWYNFSVSEKPAVFLSILPAWNDINIKNISDHIIPSCFFAHVRAAGLDSGLGAYNCHPFHYEQYLFMHNGGIGGFKKIKLDLFNLLDQRFFLNVKGQTDTEAFFALWLTFFVREENNLKGMISAWRKSLAALEALQAKYGITEKTHINAVVTDGTQMVGVRYKSQTDTFLSLHYVAGKSFTYSDTGFHMLPSENPETFDAVLLSSERLTLHREEWKDVPGQHFFIVDKNKKIQIIPI